MSKAQRRYYDPGLQPRPQVYAGKRQQGGRQREDRASGVDQARLERAEARRRRRAEQRAQQDGR